MNYANKIESQRKPYYNKARSVMRKVLRSYTDSLMEDINKASTPQQILLVSNKELRNTQVASGLDKIYRVTMPFFAEQSVKQLKPKKSAPDPIETDFWQSYIDKWVKSRLAQRITWITNTTKEVFVSVCQRVVDEAIKQGFGVDKIARQIQKELNISEKYRAERIARTEVVSASNQGSIMGAISTDLDLDKEWIAYVDDRTRESHIALNGNVVGMRDVFSNGLEFPGDPAGDGAEVINCRCTIGYVRKESDVTIGREIPE